MIDVPLLVMHSILCCCCCCCRRPHSDWYDGISHIKSSDKQKLLNKISTRHIETLTTWNVSSFFFLTFLSSLTALLPCYPFSLQLSSIHRRRHRHRFVSIVLCQINDNTLRQVIFRLLDSECSRWLRRL